MFDLDGTLVDSQLGIIRCINHALTELGEAARDPNELVPMIGPPLYRGFGRLLDTTDDARIKLAIAAYRERYTDTGIYECELYPQVEWMLDELRQRGHRIHVVTAKPERFAKRIIPHFRLDAYIEGIYGPTLEDNRDGKSHLIQRAISGQNIDLNNVLMIGDRNRDLLGANEVGIPCAGVLWGYGSEEELAACQPFALFREARQIPDGVKRNT